MKEMYGTGHTGSWSGAYPEVVTCRDQFWLQPGAPWGLRMASEPGWPGQLNPLHPLTYKVVKNLIEEVASLFPDNFFHGGGDEVNPNCWNNSLDIQVSFTCSHSVKIMTHLQSSYDRL